MAVSGGVDSMVLLHAAVHAAPESVACVASFDHGTGGFAKECVDLVRRSCARYGVPVEVGSVAPGLRTEAQWRSARWAFLRDVAAGESSRSESVSITTAHSANDHLETVAMRVLRRSGARGLAGLNAESEILRPLLRHSRGEIAEYAEQRVVEYMDDPTNSSRAHLRNRMRHDILPALARVDPDFVRDLLEISRKASAWRRDAKVFADQLAATPMSNGRLSFDLGHLGSLEPDLLASIVPAIAARAGITLDRRGTVRLSQLIANGRVGKRAQLSGGYEAVRTGSTIVFGTTAVLVPSPADLQGECQWGAFTFRRVAVGGNNSQWLAQLPASLPLRVRAWEDGDRMRPAADSPPRRVKRFLSDAGIRGTDRAVWPVVLAGDNIIWIPGVRRGQMAGSPNGEDIVWYECERRID